MKRLEILCLVILIFLILYLIQWVFHRTSPWKPPLFRGVEETEDFS